MTQTTDFLNTLPFLDDAQRKLLVAAEFDTPDAVLEAGYERFTLAPFMFPEGRARKLLAAARAGQFATSTPVAVVISHAEPPDHDQRIDAALEEKPPRLARLRDLGVTHVVRKDGVIQPAATRELQTFAARPFPPTWRGMEVASVAELLAPPATWRNPRTQQPLQGAGYTGVDEVTGDPWGQLGLDGLCVALFGEEAGFFNGLTDQAVLDNCLLGSRSALRAKIEARMAATKTTVESLRSRVEVATMPDRPGAVASKTWGAPAASFKRTGYLPNDLAELFKALFSSSELHEIIAGISPNAADNINWSESLAGVSSAAANAMVRHGWTGTEKFAQVLITARPHRRAEIMAVLGR